MREAAVTLAHRHEAIAQLANPRQTLPIGYPDSPLSAPSDPAAGGPAPGDPPREAPLRGPLPLRTLEVVATGEPGRVGNRIRAVDDPTTEGRVAQRLDRHAGALGLAQP